MDTFQAGRMTNTGHTEVKLQHFSMSVSDRTRKVWVHKEEGSKRFPTITRVTLKGQILIKLIRGNILIFLHILGIFYHKLLMYCVRKIIWEGGLLSKFPLRWFHFFLHLIQWHHGLHCCADLWFRKFFIYLFSVDLYNSLISMC